ncbi:MAG: signal peptidase II [Candidatus Doudnabacteria bacterium]|nr:signal peptidase II [Candidatus Doudnabacteria bacterium]
MISVFFISIFVLIDQITKFISLSIFRNYNFAFSLPVPVWIMYIIYTAVLFFVLKYVVQNFIRFGILELLSWILILAGAFSNIFERIFLGYVRDWIYIFSGVFNLADIYIIFAVIYLLVQNKK